MLHLTTAAGERLEIPPGCIIAVMKPSDGSVPASVVIHLGEQPEIHRLSNQYGFVKKAVVDTSSMVNPVEVRTVEAAQPVEGQPAGTAEGLMFFARSRIKARREVKEHEQGVRSVLYVDLFGPTRTVNCADTLDEIDGVEPAASEPNKPARRAQPKGEAK